MSNPPTADIDKLEEAQYRAAQMNINNRESTIAEHDLEDSPEGPARHQRRISGFPTPRSTFLPPESPNALSPTHHFKSLGGNLSEYVTPTVPVDDYKGLKLGSARLPGRNLASVYDGKSAQTQSYDGHNDSPDSKSTFTFRSADTTPSKNKCDTSDTTSLMSGFANLDDSPTRRYQISHQTKTFTDLAHEKGVRPWNSSLPDHRWQLGPEEIGAETPSYVGGLTWSSRNPWNSTDSSPQRSSPDRTGAVTKIDQRAPTSSSPAVTRVLSHVPLPPEAKRLTSLIKEFQSSVPSLGPEVNQKHMRGYFYDRVFGQTDGPEDLDRDEAGKLVIHDGKSKTLGDVRLYILDTIDELVHLCMQESQHQNAHLNTHAYTNHDQVPVGSRSQRLYDEDHANGGPGDIASANNTYWGAVYANLMAAPQKHHDSSTGTYTITNETASLVPYQQHQRKLRPAIQMQTQQIPNGLNSSNGFHGPNGIFIPHDRQVRPPASNRRALLFAQSGAWQANQMQGQAQIGDHNTPSLRPSSSAGGNRQSRQPSPAQSDNRRLAYLEGSEEMYFQPTGNGASVRLQNLVRNPVPDYSIITHANNIPFVESARAARPAEWGVLRLSNIPYDLSKHQVTTFLGTHAKLITPDIGPSIHIIMDRASGKTQDCFVEFFSVEDARVWDRSIRGRGSQYNRIGDRLIEVSLSNQDDLLRELFPRAKSVVWEGGNPKILTPEEPYNTGFKTFLSAEELQIHVRHAEQPQRSNYTMRCQSRPYEAMISLLAKFPWQATAHYTMATRNKIFEAVQKMVSVLCREIRRNSPSHAVPQQPHYPSGMIGTGITLPPQEYALPRQPIVPSFTRSKGLTPALLTDLLRAALNTPGFSELQRWTLYHSIGADLNIRQNFVISPLAQNWPFEALGRKRGIEEDVVNWYARIMGQQRDVLVGAAVTSTAENPFGDMRMLFARIGEDWTMDQAGNIEWEAMGQLIVGHISRAHQAEEQRLAAQ